MAGGHHAHCGTATSTTGQRRKRLPNTRTQRRRAVHIMRTRQHTTGSTRAAHARSVRLRPVPRVRAAPPSVRPVSACRRGYATSATGSERRRVTGGQRKGERKGTRAIEGKHKASTEGGVAQPDTRRSCQHAEHATDARGSVPASGASSGHEQHHAAYRQGKL